MDSQKVVTSVKTGVQGIHKHLKILDSGFRRNDGKEPFQTFYEAAKFIWKYSKRCPLFPGADFSLLSGAAGLITSQKKSQSDEGLG
jgi:hypothetical protein